MALGRPIAELKATAEEIQRDSNRRKAEAAARQRTKKLAVMAADPTPTLRKTEQLVEQRSVDAYHPGLGVNACHAMRSAKPIKIGNGMSGRQNCEPGAARCDRPIRRE